MAMTDLDKKVELIVNQLVERFNMATQIALDENKKFEQAQEIFEETLAVLDYYGCNENTADQLINFSKVAFFRKYYDKALGYATQAVSKSVGTQKENAASCNLHDMAFKIFENILVANDDENLGVNFDDVEEYLNPEDYCTALKHTYMSKERIKTNEDRDFFAKVFKKLTIEVMRQGIRYGNKGQAQDGLKLLKMVQPFLTQKRAQAVEQEIKKMEAVVA